MHTLTLLSMLMLPSSMPDVPREPRFEVSSLPAMDEADRAQRIKNLSRRRARLLDAQPSLVGPASLMALSSLMGAGGVSCIVWGASATDARSSRSSGGSPYTVLFDAYAGAFGAIGAAFNLMVMALGVVLNVAHVLFGVWGGLLMDSRIRERGGSDAELARIEGRLLELGAPLGLP